MMVGNPSNRSWSMLNNLNMHQQQQHNLPPNSASSPPSQLLIPNNNTTSTSTSTSSHPNNLMLNHFPGHDQQHQHDQQLISSNHSPWSNLLLRGGLSTREEDEEEEEEDKDAESDDHQVQYQELCLASNISTNYPSFLHPSSVLPNLMIKPEVISLNNPHNHPETNSLLFLMYANSNNHQYDHVLPPQPTTLLPPSSSSHQVIRASSCRNLNTTTTTSSNSKSMLDFSAHRPVNPHDRQYHLSRAKTGGVEHNYNNNKKKKARVHHHHDQQQASSSQPFLKVRKEKLGDRITALHQLVSPFGKTDTASVLLEAIGCIRFLQAQIEALSSPYAAAAALPPSSNSNITAQQHGSDCQEVMGPSRDLRSRGLCLVPVTCTQHVGGAGGNEGVGTVDYNWAPAIGGGF